MQQIFVWDFNTVVGLIWIGVILLVIILLGAYQLIKDFIKFLMKIFKKS